MSPVRLVLPAAAAAAALALPALAEAASPCSLASQAAVKSAFGGSVAPGKVESGVYQTCHWKVTGSPLGVPGEAVVFLAPEQSAATFKIAKKGTPGAVAVKGVGDDAFYNPLTTAVELIKGGKVASAQGIFVNPGGPKPDAAKVRAGVILLAKTVATHV